MKKFLAEAAGLALVLLMLAAFIEVTQDKPRPWISVSVSVDKEVVTEVKVGREEISNFLKGLE